MGWPRWDACGAGRPNKRRCLHRVAPLLFANNVTLRWNFSGKALVSNACQRRGQFVTWKPTHRLRKGVASNDAMQQDACILWSWRDQLADSDVSLERKHREQLFLQSPLASDGWLLIDIHLAHCNKAPFLDWTANDWWKRKDCTVLNGRVRTGNSTSLRIVMIAAWRWWTRFKEPDAVSNSD